MHSNRLTVGTVPPATHCNVAIVGQTYRVSTLTRLRKRRLGKILISLLILGSALAACSTTNSSPSTGPKTKVSAKLQSFTLGTFTSGSFEVEIELMQAQGIFAKYGLTPRIVSATSGPAIQAGELSGTIDIGFGYMGLIIPAMIHGNKFEFVSPIAGPNFYNVIAQPSIPVKPPGIGLTSNARANIRAMRGATVGVAAVGGLNYLTMAALAKASGLSPTAFTQVAAGGPATLVTAFETHRFQYLVTDHPVFTLLKQQHIPYHLVALVNSSANNDWKHMVADDWVATPTFIKSHKSLVMDFCRAMVAGSHYIGDPAHKEQVIAAAERIQGIKPAEAGMWYRNNLYLYYPGIPMTKKVWKAQKEWLAGGPYASSPLPSFKSVDYSPCLKLAT